MAEQPPKKKLIDHFKEGYEEQDRKIKADNRKVEDRMIEGVAQGTSETLFHPFRWLRALIK